MTKTKTTPHGGSSSHRPRGMATARFAGAEGEAEQQFKDAPGEETEDSQEWPDWKEGASKCGGKTEGGAKAPPEENPPPPPDP